MQVCYLGIDDGYFEISFKRSELKHKTVLVGAIVCNNRFVDLFIDFITIDGLDATTAINRIIEISLTLYNIASVFLDGVTYAGFNVVDPRKLYLLNSIPVIVIFRHRLDLEKIRAALERHFHDHRYRFSIIEDTYSKSSELLLEHLPTVIKIYSVGVSLDKAKNITLSLCKVFADPYPLRVADKIASALGKIMIKKLLERSQSHAVL